MEKRERPWWRKCEAAEFQAKLSGMPAHEVEALGNEIGAAIARTNEAVSDSTADPALRKRARTALAHMVVRKRLLKARLQVLHAGKTEERSKKRDGAAEKEAARRDRTSRARAALEAGDVGKAVGLILDILER